MTWKDKLEIGLKNDAPFRKDNLAPDQVHGPEIESGPGRSPVIPEAQEDREHDANRVQEDALTDTAGPLDGSPRKPAGSNSEA